MKINVYREYIWFVNKNDFVSYDHGWGNGYVGVPKHSDHHQIDYNKLSVDLDVHGGLTFSSRVENWYKLKLPMKYHNQYKDYWVFGFDTAHAGDTLETWPKSKVETATLDLAVQLYMSDNLNFLKILG